MRAPMLVLIGLLVAIPAVAQERAAPARTVDDYLCTFAGKCGVDDAEEVTRKAPETKGFRLARPTGGQVTAPARTVAPADGRRARAATGTASRGRAAAVRQPVRIASDRRSRRGASSAMVSTPATMLAAGERRADLQLSFENGSDRMTVRGMEEARVFAQSLIRPELVGKRFMIEGHTNAVGGRAYNLDLSQRRAKAVADYLASLGVARDRLDVRGLGFDRPLGGRRAMSPLNRRVEAVLVS